MNSHYKELLEKKAFLENVSNNTFTKTNSVYVILG